MIITRTPLRVSLFGGGTDFKEYFAGHGGGACLNFTIDKFITVILNERHDNKIRVCWGESGNVEIVDRVDELKHELIRESMKLVGVTEGIEIVTISDIPSNGSGLGSSGAVTVGVLSALLAYKNRDKNIPKFTNDFIDQSPSEIAKLAYHVEAERLEKPVGIQDQLASAVGGYKLHMFNWLGQTMTDYKSLNTVYPSWINDHCQLFHLGNGRDSSTILQNQKDSIDNRIPHLNQLKTIAFAISTKPHDYKVIGYQLQDAWKLKKQLAKGISNDHIDNIYNEAMAQGAYGAKVCGAGGGGYLLTVSESPIDLPNEMKFKYYGDGVKVVYVS